LPFDKSELRLEDQKAFIIFYHKLGDLYIAS
jgi:hypothetical protein